MGYTLDMLKQIAAGLAKQFGPDCEIVIHDLKRNDVEHSIVHIENGGVSGRQLGGGASKIVLETIHKHNLAKGDRLGYLSTAENGKLIKSSTIFIKNEDGESLDYIFSINMDITRLSILSKAIEDLTGTDESKDDKTEKLMSNVNDLLDSLIEQSVTLIGKPVSLMKRDEKKRAIQFLNESGAFLITRSGDKVSEYFGISKYTLYKYIGINK